MISLFISIKNVTLWRTRVLRSFDGKNKFTAELRKWQSQTLGCWALSELEEVMSSPLKQPPSAMIVRPAIPNYLLQNLFLSSCF